MHSVGGGPEGQLTWMAGAHSANGFGCRGTVNPSTGPAPRDTLSGQLLGCHTAMQSGIVVGSVWIRAGQEASQDHQSSRVRRNFQELLSRALGAMPPAPFVTAGPLIPSERDSRTTQNDACCDC